IASRYGVSKVFVHALTDGRDTDPKGGLTYVNVLQQHLAKTGGQLASVIGRYYAMDRDKRWERVKLAYDLLVNGIGINTKNIAEEIERSYSQGVTDEFIKPICGVDEKGNPFATIKEGDEVI